MVNEEEKWIKHYSSRHEILLVGEGDFSFAASLATAFGVASNITATSLDSEVVLWIKHPTAATNVALLKHKGCTVMHDVDASSMSQHPLLSHKRFDRIVFNFPHAGFIKREDNTYQISLHQEVVRGFLRSGYGMLRERGEIHVTHKTPYPYSMWEIERSGRELGLTLTEKADFYKGDYPGYQNRRGGDTSRSNDTFPVGASCTFKFAKL